MMKIPYLHNARKAPIDVDVLPLLLMGSVTLASGGSVLEPAGIGSVRHGGSFWHLLIEDTPYYQHLATQAKYKLALNNVEVPITIQLTVDPDQQGYPAVNIIANPTEHLLVHVVPVLRAPELDAVLQVGSHESGVEGQNHLPRPAGHAFDVAQDAVGFLNCKRTLLAYVELLINQHPQVLLLRAALNPFTTQPVLISGISPTHVQDPALGLVEPQEVLTGPLLKPVQVPLDGIQSLRHVNLTTQIGVIGKLAEVALNPKIHVTNKDIKKHRSLKKCHSSSSC
ncbi:hypothetical protein llap_9848 [Limosa lapponica baueri]|uniref:Uncharacterized protein n=1 Tax=Limosa lapponica baueri TaxID=1758121 RepID=A0A2I0U1D4_LIMLA|nr:hypothetical protein llap_9848 [Limosa lapponica baueri]